MFKRFARSASSSASAPVEQSINFFAPVYLVGHLGEDDSTVHQGENVSRFEPSLRPALQQLRAGMQYAELTQLLGQNGPAQVQELLAQQVVVIDPTEDPQVYSRLTMRGQLQTVHTEHKSAVQARSMDGREALVSASTYALVQRCVQGHSLAEGAVVVAAEQNIAEAKVGLLLDMDMADLATLGVELHWMR